jgi:predicted DNA-binding protein with PD1-like motif
MRRLPLAFALLVAVAFSQTPPAAQSSTSVQRAHVLRLKPGADLVESIREYARANSVRSAAVLTAVGSLTQARIRFADRPQFRTLSRKFEIVSLAGVIDAAGGHLHIALSDGRGRTLGGHVDKGCLVYTTAEIVLAEFPELEFAREPEPASGYRELVIGAR